MKKLMLLSVLMLAVLLVGFSNTDASLKPSDYQDIIRPGGEDHPWGGEQFDDPSAPLMSAQPPTKWVSPYPIVDYLFSKFFFDYIVVEKTKDVSVQQLNGRQISDPFNDYRETTTSTVAGNN